jgi:hypothetical protein
MLLSKFYTLTYFFETNDRGCQIMGKKKERPRKRAGVYPKWEPLARKEDGYLQVTVCGVGRRHSSLQRTLSQWKASKGRMASSQMEKVQWIRSDA